MRSIYIIVLALFLSFATVIDGFVCPRDGYFANPDNEHGYFKCVAGMLFHATCALDLLWIQRDQKCGWAADQGMSKSVFYYIQSFFVAPKRFQIATGGNTTTGKCLDIAGGVAVDHAQLQLFRCQRNSNQEFEFHHDGTIRVMGKCLDIPDSVAYDHQGVQLFDCRPDQDNQQFLLDTINRIQIMGKCLDVPNGEVVNNNPLQLFRCHEQASQRFTLVPV